MYLCRNIKTMDFYELENYSTEQAYYLSQMYNDFIESELLQELNN